MNFQYEQPGQQQPGQGQPYIIQIPFGQQPIQHQQPEDHYKLSQSQFNEIHAARMRNTHAQCRITETRVLLDGLHEIRTALDQGSLTVAQGDTGSKDRPPLEPAFNEVNRLKLQNAYLRMVERFVNHTEDWMGREMDIAMTNEIKKDQTKSE